MTAQEQSRRRGRPPLEGRREEILDAAVEVMAARGIERTSMAQLAEELGLSTYALTYHFGSKEGVLVAIAQHVETHLNREFAGIRDIPDLTVAGLVRGYWATYGQSGAAGSTRLWLELGMLASREPDRFPGFVETMVDGWRRTLVSFMPGHPEADQIATLAFGAILGLEILETASPGSVTAATLDRLAQMFEHTLAT